MYDLKLPENAVLDAAATERTTAFARTSGLSPEQAQQVLAFANQEVAAQRDALLAAHQPGGAAWEKQLNDWRAQTLADSALGATPEERTATIARGTSVLKRYAAANPDDAQAMTSFLDTSGLGEHPAAVRFFAWLGKAAGEGTLPPPAPPAPPSGSGAAVQKKYIDGGMNP